MASSGPKPTLQRQFEDLLAWKNVDPSRGTPLHQLRSLVVLQGIPPPRVPRKASKRRSKRRSSSTIRTRSAAQRRGSSRNTKRAHKVRGASVGPSGDRTGGDTLRGRVWRVLLGVPPTACLEYPQWLALGASPQAADIDADVTRTFRGDADFEARVPQQSLTRVLNAFVHKARSMWPTPDGSGDDTATGGATTGGAITGGATGDGGDAASSVDDMEGWWQSDEEDGGAAGPTQATGNQQGRTAGSGDAAGERSAEPADPERHLSYGQGLNTLCGALLMAMPEREAFGTLVTLATRHCPRYYTGDKTVGVHEGCRLFGELLEQCDPEVSQKLQEQEVPCNVLIAFPRLLSLMACRPPVLQLLRVWDVMFAYGVYFATVLAAAECVLMRSQLLDSPLPTMVMDLRRMPPLDAASLLSTANKILAGIPNNLYARIVIHPRMSIEALTRAAEAKALTGAAGSHGPEPGNAPRAGGAATASPTEHGGSTQPQVQWSQDVGDALDGWSEDADESVGARDGGTGGAGGGDDAGAGNGASAGGSQARGDQGGELVLRRRAGRGRVRGESKGQEGGRRGVTRGQASRGCGTKARTSSHSSARHRARSSSRHVSGSRKARRSTAVAPPAVPPRKRSTRAPQHGVAVATRRSSHETRRVHRQPAASKARRRTAPSATAAKPDTGASGATSTSPAGDRARASAQQRQERQQRLRQLHRDLLQERTPRRMVVAAGGATGAASQVDGANANAAARSRGHPATPPPPPPRRGKGSRGNSASPPSRKSPPQLNDISPLAGTRAAKERPRTLRTRVETDRRNELLLRGHPAWRDLKHHYSNPAQLGLGLQRRKPRKSRSAAKARRPATGAVTTGTGAGATRLGLDTAASPRVPATHEQGTMTVAPATDGGQPSSGASTTGAQQGQHGAAVAARNGGGVVVGGAMYERVLAMEATTHYVDTLDGEREQRREISARLSAQAAQKAQERSGKGGGRTTRRRRSSSRSRPHHARRVSGTPKRRSSGTRAKHVSGARRSTSRPRARASPSARTRKVSRPAPRSAAAGRSAARKRALLHARRSSKRGTSSRSRASPSGKARARDAAAAAGGVNSSAVAGWSDDDTYDAADAAVARAATGDLPGGSPFQYPMHDDHGGARDNNNEADALDLADPVMPGGYDAAPASHPPASAASALNVSLGPVMAVDDHLLYDGEAEATVAARSLAAARHGGTAMRVDV